MTDNLRTKNIWYDARSFNATNQQIPATTDQNLIYPLLQDASNYNVGVSKATIPLNTIPLRQTNLPLKYYEVGLQQGQFTGTAFIRQVNSTNDNFVWSLSGLTLSKYKYTSSSAESVGTIDLSPFMSYAFNFVLDDYQNLYVAGSLNNVDNPDTIFIISQEAALLTSLSGTNISSIYINGIQNFYYADELQTGFEVNVYSNQNGENSVNLTLIGTITTSFAGTPLQNVAFVCATLDTIMVGHDGNVITFYNNELQAQNDFTVTDFTNLGVANCLNGDNTLMISNYSSLNDALFSTRSDQLIYNVESNSQVAAGSLTSKIAITSTGFVFAIGTDDRTYFTQTSAFPNATWAQINSTQIRPVICSNQNMLLALSSSNHLLFWNMGLVDNSSWYDVSQIAYTITPTISISDMDMNVNTNKLIAVGSDNNLYITNEPVAPFVFSFVNTATNQCFFTQATGNGQEPNVLQNLDSVPKTLTTPQKVRVSAEGYYYILEGQQGIDAQINKYNPAGLAFTQMATYQFGYNSIIDFCFVGLAGAETLCILTGDNKVKTYAIDTTTQLTTFNVGGNGHSICARGISNCAIGYSVGNNGFIEILDLNTNLSVNNYQLTVVNASSDIQPFSISENPTDSTGGGISLFVSINYVDGFGNSTQLQKITYDTNQNATGFNIIFDYPEYTSASVSCTSTTGLVAWYFKNMQNVGIMEILVQANNYNVQESYQLPNIPTTATSMYVAPTINLINTWTQITTNILCDSVAVSRTSSNQLYVVNNADSTLYSGFLSGTSITFSQMAYSSQQQLFIATTPNTTAPTNTSVKTLTISSQQQLGTISLTNLKLGSIAKNEINQVQTGLGEFLLPTTTSSITSYSITCLTNYTINVSNAGLVFAKNGEDIDAGAYSIYSYSTLIDAINVAFQEAYLRIKANNPSPPAEAPSISLNYQTKLCTLTYSSDYTTSTNNGIFFNVPLMGLITFRPNQLSTVTALSGLYKIILPPNSTSLTQSSGTIYQFNLLYRIGIQSNTIYVSDSYFGNNQTNRIVSTIDVPTDEILENNTTLFYQPTFMRPYSLASTNAINRIQVDILYLYRDFTQYQLLLNPSQNWDVEFCFIRK